jgi:eIF3 subunit 6 N terminal domain
MTAGGSSSSSTDDSSNSEQWDLTPMVAPYLDRQMVLPLLEFLKERVDAGALGYSHADLDRARLEIVRPTNMVDFAEDLYQSLHKGGDVASVPTKELQDQKQAVYKQKEQLEAACERLLKFPAEERVRDLPVRPSTHVQHGPLNLLLCLL